MKLVALLLVICSLFLVHGQPYTDCADAASQLNVANDGWYEIFFPSGNKWIYCCYKSTGALTGYAYALFSTYEFALGPFLTFAHGNKPFTVNYPQNEQLAANTQPTASKLTILDPLWANYRWSTVDIYHYRGNTSTITHWIVTCDFEINFNIASDYWLVNMNEFSFLTFSDLSLAQFAPCLFLSDNVVVRGYSCLSAPPPCNVGFYMDTNLPPQIDGNWPSCTGHTTPATEFPFKTTSNVVSEDSFGVYFAFSPEHLCSSRQNATTNHWMCQVYTLVPVGGDPHFVSLDGLKFKYDGPCSYMLLSNKCGDKDQKYPHFEIISHHGHCRSRTADVMCIKKLSINLWNKASKLTKMELESHTDFMINGYKMNLPYSDEKVDIVVEPYQDKRGRHERLKIHFEFGMNILWSNDASGTLKVGLAKKFETCGLLGNSNGNKDDDLMMKDGTVLAYTASKKELDNDIVIQMADSWFVHTPHEKLRCRLHPQHSMASQKICAFNKESVVESCENMIQTQLKKLSGANVDKCFPKDSTFETRVDASRVYDDCITEVCSCKKDLFKDCVPKVAMEEFKDACVDNGVEFPELVWAFE